MPRKWYKLWCLTRKARCVVCIAMVYFLFSLVLIFGGCKNFYNSQVIIWRYFRLNFEFVKNTTAKETHHIQANPQSDRFTPLYDFENPQDLDKMKPRDKGIVDATLSKKREIKEDSLLPLREMFAKAGEEAKRREKALTSTSIDIPLTDLSVIDDKLKPQVLLLVVVSSAAARKDRRDAIRQTWWKKCSAENVSVSTL